MTDDISTSQEASGLSCHLPVTLEVRMGSWKDKEVINGRMLAGAGGEVVKESLMPLPCNIIIIILVIIGIIIFCINKS